MSLVDPRPLLVRYLERYSPEQRRRHAVRPGVTGLAQVSGRNAIGWDEKFAKDVEYVDSRSLLLDVRSEEHTSELQSLMRISYAVFCLKKKTNSKPKVQIYAVVDISTPQNV